VTLRPVTRLRLAARTDHTLGNILERLAEVHGDATLVTAAGAPSRSYREAAAEVDVWAGALHRSIRPGDRVVLATTNGYDQFLLCLAVCRAGGIAVPVNPQMRADEIDHVVADAQAALVVGATTELEERGPLGWSVHADPGEVAALFYTSGTTGAPKGVSLTHRGLLARGPTAMRFPLEVLGRGEAVVALPVAHIMGFAACLGFACAGIPVYSMERFRPLEVLDAIEHRRSTIFIGVPAMYRMLVDAGAERRNLRTVHLWLSGADAMPSDLARRFQQMGSSATLPVVGPV